MGELLDPIGRMRRGIKRGLVAHTAAMFLIVTTFTASSLDLRSAPFIDYRRTSEPGDIASSGRYSDLTGWVYFATPDLFFVMNSWLADGLLVSSAPGSLPVHLIQAILVALSLLRYLRQE